MSLDVVGGAAEGAATGFAIGGPAGAIVGGVIGGIKGVFSSKSKKYARRAAQEQIKAQDLQDALARRNLLLEGYVTRANQAAMAGAVDEGGGMRSSAALGAISSTRTQLRTNLQTFDRSTAYRRNYTRYRGKADKYANYAGNVAQLGQLWNTYGGGIIDWAKKGSGPGPGAYRQQPGGGGVGPVLPP